jgi:hypothetical protein
MIGRSKINEILPDITQNKHVILIRLGKEEMFIQSLISHCWKSQI